MKLDAKLEVDLMAKLIAKLASKLLLLLSLSFAFSNVCQAWSDFKPAVGRSLEQKNPDWMMGAWKFSGYIYHDEFKLPLNPHLILLFQFFADGTDDLAWRRDEEPGFCERKGNFSVEGDYLIENVTWLNPDNDISCSQDPEMVLGRKTNDEIHLVQDKLYLYLSLSGEPFIYVFERTSLPAKWPRSL